MATVQPPPMPRSKRRNSFLRLYDGPLYRDWAFWLTIGNALLAAISIPTSDTPSTQPVWLDTILAIFLISGLFGVLPTWLRLLFRRWRWRKAQMVASGQPTPMHQAPAHPAPMQWARRANWQERTAMPAPPHRPYEQPKEYPAPSPLRSSRPPQQPIAEPTLIDIAPPSRSDDLVAARKSLQHPIARAVRVLQQAHTPRDQYEAILDTAETLATTISLTAAALLRDQTARADGVFAGDPARRALAALRAAYTGQGAMFGTWTNWLGNLRPLLDAYPTLIPGLSVALETHPNSPSIIDELNALREERNRAAHRNRPHTMQESALRVAELMPRIESVLRSSRFLENTPWLLTVSCSYQPRSRVFDVVTRRVMGDHPDFEMQSFSWQEPVADDMVYVLGPDGPVMMSPFVASRFCTHCHQVEVCYAYRTGKQEGPATFKSFDSGHDIRAEELGDDLRALPARDREGR